MEGNADERLEAARSALTSLDQALREIGRVSQLSGYLSGGNYDVIFAINYAIIEANGQLHLARDLGLKGEIPLIPNPYWLTFLRGFALFQGSRASHWKSKINRVKVLVTERIELVEQHGWEAVAELPPLALDSPSPPMDLVGLFLVIGFFAQIGFCAAWQDGFLWGLPYFLVIFGLVIFWSIKTLLSDVDP